MSPWFEDKDENEAQYDENKKEDTVPPTSVLLISVGKVKSGEVNIGGTVPNNRMIGLTTWQFSVLSPLLGRARLSARHYTQYYRAESLDLSP